MPQLNKEKLDQMVEAAFDAIYPKETRQFLLTEMIPHLKNNLRTALTPFCMEMTDEEIERESKLYYKPHGSNIDIESFRKGVYTGARFMRDKDGK